MIYKLFIIIIILLILINEVILDYLLVLIDLEHKVCYHNLILYFDYIVNTLKTFGVDEAYKSLYSSYYDYFKKGPFFNSLTWEDLTNTLYLTKFCFPSIEHLLSYFNYNIYTFKESFPLILFYLLDISY